MGNGFVEAMRGMRRLFLPVHLLGVAPLLGCVGPLAWNVKLEDDGVMGHPVVPEFMRSAFVFPSTAVGLMPNAGECPKFLRCVYAEALGESVVAIRLGLKRAAHWALAQRHVVAGRL